MESADENAEIIFGTAIDESLKDTVKVTVIATGLGPSRKPAASKPLANKPATAHEKKDPSHIPVNASGAWSGAGASAALLGRSGSDEGIETGSENSSDAPTERTELARARAIGEKLGITDFGDNERLDIPTFLRRSPSRET